MITALDKSNATRLQFVSGIVVQEQLSAQGGTSQTRTSRHSHRWNSSAVSSRLIGFRNFSSGISMRPICGPSSSK
eukprot:2862317-Rhodomonas_salina.1